MCSGERTWGLSECLFTRNRPSLVWGAGWWRTLRAAGATRSRWPPPPVFPSHGIWRLLDSFSQPTGGRQPHRHPHPRDPHRWPRGGWGLLTTGSKNRRLGPTAGWARQPAGPDSRLGPTAGWARQSAGPNSRLDPTAGWARKSAGPESRLDPTAGWARQPAGPDRRLGPTAGWARPQAGPDSRLGPTVTAGWARQQAGPYFSIGAVCSQAGRRSARKGSTRVH
jgi:hypothetical protein